MDNGRGREPVEASMSEHARESHQGATDRDAEATKHVSSIGLYTVVYVALMILLCVTVTLDLLLTHSLRMLYLATIVALVIAFVKSVLVVLYFMHVRFASRLTWVFAGSAIVWLGIMVALTFSDYITRSGAPARLIQTPMYEQIDRPNGAQPGR
jgi:cytochrome c oxidase subunit 4